MGNSCSNPCGSPLPVWRSGNVLSDESHAPLPARRPATEGRVGEVGALGMAPERPDGTAGQTLRLRSAESAAARAADQLPSAAGAVEAPVGLTSLPGHLLDDLMEHLTNPERERIGAVPNRHLSESIRHQVSAARLQREAPTVNSLVAFVHALIGYGQGTAADVIATLPPRLRRAPLIAMGCRILALPEQERDAAAAAWAAFPHPGSPGSLLSDLRSAAARGAAGLERREQELVGAWGEAYFDILRGRNVQQVAQARAITGAMSIEILDLEAVRVIGERLTEHDHLPTLLQRAGVTSESAIAQLQDMAARRVGTAAVRCGLSVADVIQRMGITWPPAIRHLSVEGARRDVALGANVPAAAHAYGVSDIQDTLELHATTTAGRRMVLGGGSPGETARQLGIRTPALIAQLAANLVAAGSAAARQARWEQALVMPGGQAYQDVVAGANVQEVAQRLVIATPASLGFLESHAATRIANTLRASDHLPTLIEEAGVTSPHLIQQLEQQAADGPGTSAVHRGMEPAAVAAQMGITTPAARHALDLAAAEGDISLGANAQVVMLDRNITDPGEHLGLELWAVASHGQRALDAGESVPGIAQRIGIRRPEVIQALAHQAAATVGVAAIFNGAEPDAIAARLQIRDPGALHMLDMVAAERDIEWGGNAQEVMRVRNVTVAHERQRLERWAVATNGQRALIFGEPVDRIAQRIGIQDPQALLDLHRRAAQRAIHDLPANPRP